MWGSMCIYVLGLCGFLLKKERNDFCIEPMSYVVGLTRLRFKFEIL